MLHIWLMMEMSAILLYIIASPPSYIPESYARVTMS